MRELETDTMLMALYETQRYMSAIEITVAHLRRRADKLGYMPPLADEESARLNLLDEWRKGISGRVSEMLALVEWLSEYYNGDEFVLPFTIEEKE